MTFAKYTMFELIRAIRRLGTVGLFIMGLLVGSTLIAAFSDEGGSGRSTPSRFAADASEPACPSDFGPPTQPWSRVMGGGGFEKVTDVAVTPGNELVFAGLTLGVEHEEASHAVLVRTGPDGFVHSQSRIDDPLIGSVSRVILDEQGASRLVHWVGMRPAFARTDAAGNVIWSRLFDTEGESVWADVRPGDAGHSIIVLAESDAMGSSLKVVRLDHAGKLLWRANLDQGGYVENIRMVDSGDGGALIALETSDRSVARQVSLVRLDRRGRIAWERDIANGEQVRLADAALDTEGSVILLSGTPSALVRFDGLGQISWMRDLPALSTSGRHVVAAMDEGLVQVMAEPAAAGMGRRHWVARFDSDGREIWSKTRANRSNTTLEAVRMASNGAIVAGGSMVGSSDGDTDMLMMTVAVDGTFPQGFGSVPSFVDEGAIALADIGEPAPAMLAASMVVDGSLALEVAYAADTAAKQVAGRPNAIRLPPSNGGPVPAPTRTATAALAAERNRVGSLDSEVRQVSAPVEVAALAPPVATSLQQNALLPDESSVAAIELDDTDRPTVATREPAAELIASTVPAVAEAPAPGVRRNATKAAWSPREERPAYAYQCTFTCLADSEDLVKYPVTRMIANVTEDNSNLVSLDVMAMDHGICLATGGRVFDDPRLPPICNRVN